VIRRWQDTSQTGGVPSISPPLAGIQLPSLDPATPGALGALPLLDDAPRARRVGKRKWSELEDMALLEGCSLLRTKDWVGIKQRFSTELVARTNVCCVASGGLGWGLFWDEEWNGRRPGSRPGMGRS
jgi:hypothetical protein